MNKMVKFPAIEVAYTKNIGMEIKPYLFSRPGKPVKRNRGYRVESLMTDIVLITAPKSEMGIKNMEKLKSMSIL